MKKLLLLISFVLYAFSHFGQTTHFEQDFLAGTATSNFVGLPPSIGQFTEIATATGVTTTITAGRLQFARASATNPTRFSRGSNFATTPSSMYCQFSFGVTSAVAQATSATFNFGGTNLADGATTVTDVYSKVSVNLNATNGFTLQSGATVSTTFTGNQDITWVMNNTGATFTYMAPNGTNETLGNDQFDLWVGTTKVFNDLAVNAPTQTINRFKFNFDVGIATLSFDNFLMRDVTGSLLVNTNVATADSMLVKYVGANKNVGIGKNIVTPGNKLEIKSDTLNRSGLRLTNLKSTATTTASNGKALSVNTLGDVILVNSTASSIPDSMIVKFTGTGAVKNVGIGTAAPTATLDINGYMRLRGLLEMPTNTDFIWNAYYSSGAWKYRSAGFAGGFYQDATGNLAFNTAPSGAADGALTFQRAFTVLNNGNFGIGTTAPSNKLEVNATTGNSGVTLKGLKLANAAIRPIGIDSTGKVVLFNSVATTDTSAWKKVGNNVLNTNTGNVGIGTTNPGYKLDVNGTGRFAGDITIQKQDPILSLQNPVLSSNFYLYGGNVAKYSFDKSLGHWFDVQGTWVAQFTKDLAYIKTPLELSGYVSPKIASNATGGIVTKLQSVDNYLGYVGTESNHSLGIVTNNNIKMIVTENGNVGIGTTNTPTEKLHLRWGKMLIEADNPTLQMKLLDGTLINAIQFNAGNGNMIMANGSIEAEKWGGPTTLYVQNNNGNVGIGTRTPSNKLEVNATTGNSGVTLKGLKLANAAIRPIGIDSTGKVVLFNSVATTDTSAWKKVGNNVLNTNSGNVGIGTNNPTAKLQVKGGGIISDIQVQSENSGFIASGQTYLSQNAAGKKRVYLDIVGNTYARLGTYDEVNNTPLPLALNSAGGNVGIGTTTPNEKLEVTGNVSVKQPTFSNLSIEGTGAANYAGSGLLLKAGDVQANDKYNQTTFTTERGTTGTAMFSIQRRFSNVYNGQLADYSDINGWNLYTATDRTTATTSARLSINPNGNVGIGTITPTVPLHVVGGTNSGIRLSGTSSRFTITDNSSNLWNMDNFGGTLRFFREDYSTGAVGANGVSRMVIANNGNVGIGTDNPQALLDVTGSVLANTIDSKVDLARFSSINTNNSILRLFEKRFEAGNNWLSSSTRIQKRIDDTDMGYIEFNPKGNPYGLGLGTGTKEIMSLTTNGYMGIGTNTPTNLLTINSKIDKKSGLTLSNIIDKTVTYVADKVFPLGVNLSGEVVLNDNVTAPVQQTDINGYKTFYTNGMNADSTAPKRYEIGRIFTDVVNWSATSPVEIEVDEITYSVGAKRKYSVYFGYLNSYKLLQTEINEPNANTGRNNFQLSIGDPVLVSGTNKYLPIYVDVKYYATVKALIKTSRAISASSASGPSGSIYINTAPTATVIQNFTPDNTVMISNGASNTVLSGNVGIGTTTPNEKSLLHIKGTHSNASTLLQYPLDAPSQLTGDLYLRTWASEPNVSFNGTGIGANINNWGLVRMNNTLSSSYIRFVPQTTSGTMLFTTIDATGVKYDNTLAIVNDKVGIGTTTPTAKLEVAGLGKFKAEAVSNIGLQILDNANNISMMQFAGINLANHWYVGNDSGKFNFYNSKIGNTFTLTDNGNVGIGTTTPTEKLSIIGGASFKNETTGAIIVNDSYAGGRSYLALDGNSSNGLASGGDYLLLDKFTSGSAQLNNSGGELKLATQNAFDISILTNNTVNTVFKSNGSVNIGTNIAVPANYKLAVGGDIIAERVVVKLQTAWPDFVFKKSYGLRPLSEVEAFINLNNHLPEVPSATEVADKGIDVGAMNAKLLQKVEELTLYLIEMKKEIEALKNQKSSRGADK